MRPSKRKRFLGILLKQPERIEEVFVSILAVPLSLVIAFIFLWAMDFDPVLSLKSLLQGMGGNRLNLMRTLEKTTPLLLTGLCVAFAFQAGLFNIGGEGQLYLAAMATAIVGYTIAPPKLIHIPLALVTAALVGGLWSAIPGALKAKLGAHEVIITIMMNYIAILFTTYLASGPLKEPGKYQWVDKTRDILPSAELFRFSPKSLASAGIFVALICAIIMHLILTRTKLGYEIRATGLNPAAAEYGGISVSKNIILAMFISGMFSGVAGGSEVLGTHRHFIVGFSRGLGFDGIAVAVLGRNTAIGTILAAFLFGALKSGGMEMQMRAGVPIEMIFVVQAIIILFVAAPQIIRIILMLKKEE
ncbi:MAG: ABC transporter permease [Candidatus Heimdallarchaeota archaeon]